MEISLRKLCLLGLVILLPLQASAEDEIYTGFFSNLAVGGYDTVAYFVQGKPVKGKAEFSYEYKNTEWRFRSRQNLEKFKATPEAYAPQFGGYCAWAVAMNDTAKGDPQHWSIENGKLYLNYDADIRAKWEKDKSGFITRANQNWPAVLN